MVWLMFASHQAKLQRSDVDVIESLVKTKAHELQNTKDKEKEERVKHIALMHEILDHEETRKQQSLHEILDHEETRKQQSLERTASQFRSEELKRHKVTEAQSQAVLDSNKRLA